MMDYWSYVHVCSVLLVQLDVLFLTVVCSWRPPDYQSHTVASSPRYQSTVLLATAAVVYWTQRGKEGGGEGGEERKGAVRRG